MFGDVGHGFIMALFGFWMVYNEKKLSSRKDWGEVYIINLVLGYGFWRSIHDLFNGFVFNLYWFDLQ